MQPAPINRTLWPYLWRQWRACGAEGKGCIGGIVVSCLLYFPALLLLGLKLFLVLAFLLGLIDGLLTGFHDPVTSHLALLAAFLGMEGVRDAYAEAIRAGYLWHEFGDSHLVIP